jgi:signal peptidase I
MNEAERENAVKGLFVQSLSLGRALSFEVAGGSMKLLLAAGDSVVIRKTPSREIACGDIILFRPAGRTAEHPGVHRVLFRRKNGNSYSYRTKGDFNESLDAGWINEQEVVGKVLAIRKKRPRIEIRIDTPAGKTLSIAVAVVSLPVSLLNRYMHRVSRVCARLLRFPLPEKECVFPENTVLLRSAVDVPVQGWLADTGSNGQWLVREAMSAEAAVGDLQFEGGFSEEALSLMRRGRKVQALYAAGDVECGNTFDYVIAARMIDLLPSREQRRKLLEKVHCCLRPGGKLVVSCIHPGRSAVVRSLARFKRRAYASLFGKAYRGPAARWGVRGGYFIRYNLSEQELAHELRESRFELLSSSEKRGVVTAVAVKRAGAPAGESSL